MCFVKNDYDSKDNHKLLLKEKEMYDKCIKETMEIILWAKKIDMIN